MKLLKYTQGVLGVFLIVIITTISGFGFSTNNNVPSIFDELSYQEVVEVNLEMNSKEVFDNRRNAKEHKAIFSYLDKNGISQKWNIKVTLRGKYRRMKCENLPPLKLNFKKGDLKEAGLSRFDDMKLVTYCVEDEKDAKQLLLKEYLAYKLYNQITEESFRVQFIKINYKDVLVGEEEQQYGILIEDTAELRSRIGAEKVKSKFNIPLDSFDEEQIKTAALFQYMIGNTDWSLAQSHNVKILSKDGKKIAIPYDFDFSGLVNAPYAVLNPDFLITSNKDRIYLGDEKNVENMEMTMALFSDKKDAFLQTIKDCKLLSGKNRREMTKYIKSFYKNIDTINFPTKENIPPTLGE